jgi:hypothetical protein
MPIAALLIGSIIIVVALSGAQHELATQLETDLPAYFKWAVAIAIIGAIGFIPGLKWPSRLLLILIAVVVIFSNNNAQAIITGIQNFAQSSGQPSAPAPPSPSLATPSPTPGATGAGSLGGVVSLIPTVFGFMG